MSTEQSTTDTTTNSTEEEVPQPSEPVLTLAMQQGNLRIERYLLLSEAEELGQDILKHVALTRAEWQANQQTQVPEETNERTEPDA